MPLRKWRGNTRRENRLEELGRVDAEKAYTKKGKRNLKEEKSRVRKELATGGPARKPSGWKLKKQSKSTLTGTGKEHGGGPDAGNIGYNKDMIYRHGKYRKKWKEEMEKWKKKPVKELKPYRAKKALGGVAKILGKKTVDWIKKNRKTIQKEIYSPEGKKKTKDMLDKLKRKGLKGGSRPRPQGPHTWVKSGKPKLAIKGWK